MNPQKASEQANEYVWRLRCAAVMPFYPKNPMLKNFCGNNSVALPIRAASLAWARAALMKVDPQTQEVKIPQVKELIERSPGK